MNESIVNDGRWTLVTAECRTCHAFWSHGERLLPDAWAKYHQALHPDHLVVRVEQRRYDEKAALPTAAVPEDDA